MLEDANSHLREELLHLADSWTSTSKLYEHIMSSDKMLKFYTGLNTSSLFMTIFTLCVPAVRLISGNNAEKCALEYEQQFLISLMKLRLNCKVVDLAYRFRISKATVSRYIRKWVNVMYVRLPPVLLKWPTRDALLRTMPLYFRTNFRQCVAIIDCFECFCDRHRDIRDRASTYSSYKHHNTLKFLIAITPQGTISFISRAYCGRCSDQFIVEDSKFLGFLLPGDVVLADGGFTIETAVGMCGARLITPSFKGTRSQLTHLEVTESRKISNVRIHVERVIGALRMTYTILKGQTPIEHMSPDKNGFCFIDKVATVCACLLNSGSGVVPFS